MRANISIDDICPHPKSSTNVLKKCYDLINVFPDIKFTLFVPIAYTRLNEASYYIKNYPEFCDILRGLDKKNFELGWHGFWHGQPGVSNNDEFRYLDFKQATKIFDSMYSVVESLGLTDRFRPILRPPAFRLSVGSFDACRKKGIKVLALSPDLGYENYDTVDGSIKVIYFDSLPPIYPLVKKDKIEIVYHASEWNENILDDQQTKLLIDFLSSNKDDLEFSFMEDF